MSRNPVLALEKRQLAINNVELRIQNQSKIYIQCAESNSQLLILHSQLPLRRNPVLTLVFILTNLLFHLNKEEKMSQSSISPGIHSDPPSPC